MNGEDGAAAVVRTLQHRLQLEPAKLLGRARHFGFELGGKRFVGLTLEQFHESARIVEPRGELQVGSDPALEGANFLDLLPRALPVGPEYRFTLTGFEILEPRYLAIQVKESLVVRRGVASGRRRKR